METVDRNSICRLCLLGGDDLSSIFEANVVNGLIVADLIKDLLQFQVSINDGYPHLVCRICLSKLNEFLHFKRQCQTSRITYDNVFSTCEKASDFSIPVKLNYESEGSEKMTAYTDDASNQSSYSPIHKVQTSFGGQQQVEFGVIKSEKEEITISEEQLNYESEGSEKMTAYADDASNQMEMIEVKDEPLDSSCDEEQIKSSYSPIHKVQTSFGEQQQVESHTVIKAEPEGQEDMPYESHTVIKAEPEDQEDMPYESSYSPIHKVQTSFGEQQQVESHTVIKAEPEDQEDMPYESSYSPIHKVQTSFGEQQQVEFGVIKSETEEITISEEQLNYESEGFERTTAYADDASNQDEEAWNTRFVETARGRRKLLHDGYVYLVDKRRGMITHWRCEKRKGCSGRLKTVEDVVQGTPSDHNHPPDAARIIALRCINRIKQLAGETAEATSTIINNCTQDFPISAVGSLPKKKTLRKMIQRKRTAVDSDISCHDNASMSEDSLHINLLHSSCEEEKINL